MVLHILSTGDVLHFYQKSLVLQFKGKRRVLSTSCLNGGYREDLKAVFNHDCKVGAGIGCTLKAPTYEAHQALIAEELGLDPEFTAGLGTAASMENAAIKEESFAGLTVTAVVTGGIEVNGGRAGDPASYTDWTDHPEKPGTINTFLLIDALLPPHALARALITATEAKTAAIQELMAGSNYSAGLATGSGTDGTVIISNAEAAIKAESTGKHSKLGELIGRTVKEATKEALYKQTGLGREQQHSVLKRLKRYGITPERIWQAYLAHDGSKNKGDFWLALESLDRERALFLQTVQLVHLLDEWSWGLFWEEDLLEGASLILQKIADIYGLKPKQLNAVPALEQEVLNNLLYLLQQMIAR